MKINMINSIKHRITSVSILCRFCLASLIWIIVGGFSTSAWGGTNHAYVGVGSGSGKAVADIYSWVSSASQAHTDTATNSTLKYNSWTSKTVGTQGHCKFTAYPATGYVFTAWYKDNPTTPSATQNDNPYTTNNQYNATYTYYAIFTPITYNITYNGNTSTSGSMTASEVTYDGNVTLKDNAFVKHQCTVSFEANGGSGAPASLDVDYPFLGWATSADGSVVYSNCTTLVAPNLRTTAGNYPLYAKWGATTTPIVLPVVTKTNYAFAGWYSDSGLTTKVGGAGAEYNPSSNVTLYAKWTTVKEPSFPGTGFDEKGNKDLKVGDEYAGFTFTNTSTKVPSASTSANFYYVISKDTVDRTNQIGCPEEKADSVIGVYYDGDQTIIRALNKGRASIKFYQEAIDTESEKIKKDSSDLYTFIVDKNDPVFTWDTQTYIFNSTYANIFSSSNHDTEITCGTTNNGAAEMVAGTNDYQKTLKTYNDTSATITIEQAENYKWKHKSVDTYAITNSKVVNHVPFVYNSSMFGNESITTNKVSALGTGWNDGNNSVCLGNDDANVLHAANDEKEDKYVDIKFEGIPDTLSFNYAVNQKLATGEYWYVKESVDGVSWSDELWQTEKEGENFDDSTRIALQPTTRYIRLCYSGNFSGYYRYVTVSELQYFRSETSSINFETNYVTVPNVQTFVVEHANAGYQTSVTAPDHYQVSLDGESYSSSVTYSTNATALTGGDKMGTFTVYVKYLADVASEDPFAGNVVVSNNLSADFNVAVTGTTIKYNQSGAWKENIETLTLGTIVENAYSTNLVSESNKVSYSIVGDDEGVIEIDNDEGTLTAASVGTATIRATVAGNATYYDKTDDIEITVTNNKVQYIVWDQDKALRHLKTTDETFMLNAYATSDEDCTTNGPDAETPRPITYSIDPDYGDGEDVVTVEDNVLTIVGAGRAKVIATQSMDTDSDGEPDEDEDGHTYITVTMSKEVIVRNPSDVCPEEYLYNFNNETIVRSEPVNGETMNFVGGRSGTFSGNTLRTVESSTFSYAPAYLAYFYKNDGGSGAGSLSIQQYIPETGWDEIKTVTSFTSSWTPDTVSLNRNATKVKIVPTLTSGNIYFGGLKVIMASYAEVAQTASGAKESTIVLSAYVGGNQSKDLKVRWYSRKDMEVNLPEGSPFRITLNDVLDADELDRKCDHDTADLTITYSPTKEETHGYYNLVFTDGVYEETVVLDATATAETIRYNGEAWSGDLTEHKHAIISKGKALTVSSELYVYKLTIDSGATVTVTPTGGLKIGAGGIAGDGKDSITLKAGTTGVTKGQTGYLRIDPDWDEAMPNATVEMYSIAYADNSNRTATWQYIGIPVKDDTYGWDVCTYGKQFIYGWSEATGGWFDAYEEKIDPFKGYCVTQNNNATGRTFTFAGQLYAPSTIEIPLSYTGTGDSKGYHVLANSFAAPIDISRLDPKEDFVNASATIYLFNTGSYDKDGYTVVEDGNSTTAGQYIAVTPGTAAKIYDEDETKSYPVMIPAMQGFCVKATAASASITLDYEKLVWEADYGEHLNQPMRVVAKNTNEPSVTDFIKVTLSDGEAGDNLYLLASGSYDKSYENGYDAPKMMSDDPALPNIFAEEDDGQLAIDATSDMEGTFLGVRTGAATNYTMYFSHVDCETEWMLLDIERNEKTVITDGASYKFSAPAGQTINDRFLIVEYDGSVGVTTGTDEIKTESKIQKFIYNDQMYILKNGVLYDARGMLIRR